ncbi:MAG: transcription elongation factor GreA [Chitinophagaceae bacterium]|nr:transcription elongation factor GreA [Chitinophagaceae bacterium]
MKKLNYYTGEGLKKLKEELNHLKSKGRIDMAKQIAEARDKGDLSENAEYDAAKNAQGLLELRISKLEALLSNATVIDQSKLNTEVISLLNTVKIKNKKTNTIISYKLTPEEESNLTEGKISVTSPIGKSLIGKKKGDVVTVKAPGGNIEFEIIEISIVL